MKRGFSRRDFLKIGGLGLLSATVVDVRLPDIMRSLVSHGEAIQETAEQGVPVTKEHHWRYVVNIKKCIGCGRCVKACKLENNVPLEPEYNRTWVEEYAINDDETVSVNSRNGGIDGFTAYLAGGAVPKDNLMKSFFVPKLCNQCNKPPCVQVCPVKATYVSPEGVVLVNRNACIGCRYCVQACPYGARFLDPRLRVADKCTWCYHRITKGLLPACVEACPVGARVFGEMRDAESPLEKLLREQTLGVLKPEVGTEPKVYYIGLEKGVR